MATNAGARASYTGLVRLQKLSKTRTEMEISRLNAEMIAIGEENDALFKMQNDRFEPNVSFVPPDIIIRRLETNRTRQVQLIEQMTRRRQGLLKVSRTLDILNDRLRSHETELLRVEAAVEMDEYISQLLGRDTN